VSLADVLAANKHTFKGPRCALCNVLDTLPKDDRAALVAAVEDATFTGAAISRALKSEGHNISGPMVIRHRKGDCRA
jgi:hypothetical protein